MKCHVTGFTHPGGYNDLVLESRQLARRPKTKPDANQGARATTQVLRGVGCESCHGPGSEHVKNPNNKKMYALINPFGPSIQERKLEAIVNKDSGPGEGPRGN